MLGACLSLHPLAVATMTLEKRTHFGQSAGITLSGQLKGAPDSYCNAFHNKVQLQKQTTGLNLPV